MNCQGPLAEKINCEDGNPYKENLPGHLNVDFKSQVLRNDLPNTTC
jgi:hypothetical protein